MTDKQIRALARRGSQQDLSRERVPVPIRVRCPKCHETADLPDEARGKKGICNRCGSTVQIPVEIRKICIHCRADVTHTPHIKDAESNYVCGDCWRQRRPAPAKSAAGSAMETVTLDPAPTSTLDPDFAMPEHDPRIAQSPTITASLADDHHDDDPGDAGDVHDWPYDHRPTPFLRPRPRRRSRLPTLLSLLAVVISAATAWLVWTRPGVIGPRSAPTWEEAHRAQILVLKGQAEILVEMGHVKEGLARYEELERLVKEKVIRDPALRDELLAAWRARDTAVAREMIVQQVAQAATSASPGDVPAQTTVTLIEEPAEGGSGATTRPAEPIALPTTQRSAFDPN